MLCMPSREKAATKYTKKDKNSEYVQRPPWVRPALSQAAEREWQWAERLAREDEGGEDAEKARRRALLSSPLAGSRISAARRDEI